MMLAKAVKMGADSVIANLEDAVAPTATPTALPMVRPWVHGADERAYPRPVGESEPTPCTGTTQRSA